MRFLLIMLVSTLFGVGLAVAGETEQVAGQSAERAITADSPKGVASGYPPAGGKGSGTGHGYRQSTPGPGEGSPNYQGRRGTESPVADDSTTGAVTPQSAVPGPSGNTPGSSYYRDRGGRGYGYGRYRRGYGYGYPGYRGLGGGPYPHHRQYGNPPFYPAQPAANTTPTDIE